MGLLWRILLLVLVPAEAQNLMNHNQNLTEVKGLLGKDVTLNCSIRNSDIFWSMEIYNKLKWCIGRIYFPLGEPSYCSPGIETKYSMMDSRLVIKNMTSDDQRLYFCGRKFNGTIRLLDIFHLVSDVPDVPDVPLSDCRTQKHLVLVYRSALVVTVLVVLVIGLFLVSSYVKIKTRLRQVDQPPGVIYENSETLQAVRVEEISSQPTRRR